MASNETPRLANADLEPCSVISPATSGERIATYLSPKTIVVDDVDELPEWLTNAATDLDATCADHEEAIRRLSFHDEAVAAVASAAALQQAAVQEIATAEHQAEAARQAAAQEVAKLESKLLEAAEASSRRDSEIEVLSTACDGQSSKVNAALRLLNGVIRERNDAMELAAELREAQARGVREAAEHVEKLYASHAIAVTDMEYRLAALTRVAELAKASEEEERRQKLAVEAKARADIEVAVAAVERAQAERAAAVAQAAAAVRSESAARSRSDASARALVEAERQMDDVRREAEETMRATREAAEQEAAARCVSRVAIRDSSSERPKGTTWTPDDACNSCQLCTKAFTWARRRHHCRNCGDLVCGLCSSTFVPLPALGYRGRKRVCDACAFVLHDEDHHPRHAAYRQSPVTVSW